MKNVTSLQIGSDLEVNVNGVLESEMQSGAARNRVNRRDFLKMCGLVAAALSLPGRYAHQIADALAAAPRLPVVWLEFQDCTGDTESFLRASPVQDPLQSGKTEPQITDLLLDHISLDYHETIMVPSGLNAEKSLSDIVSAYQGQFVAIVEGSIPTADNGIYCTIGGRTALSRAQEVLPKARAVIALGSCSTDGGLAAASPNPTQAKGVNDAVPGLANLVNMPGCPANVVNLVSVIVYLITFNQLPPLDSQKRPRFAYGETIHDDCPREDHFESGRFVLAWGDEGHKKGWCLFKMGCKGPVTRNNCNIVKWNQKTNWPVEAGHPCIGCASPSFWDLQAPIYKQLANFDD